MFYYHFKEDSNKEALQIVWGYPHRGGNRVHSGGVR
jgi:hypothetical protein